MAKKHIVVIGAGTMGLWSSHHLSEKGVEVTLFDAWGAGHSRASSGGETRVIRAVYGPDRPYVAMVAESFQGWEKLQKDCQVPVLERTGSLWLCHADEDPYIQQSLSHLAEFGFQLQPLGLDELSRKYPGISTDGLRSACFEPEAGFIRARLACRLLLRRLMEAGVKYRQQYVRAAKIKSGRLQGLVLSDGSKFEADGYLFACGPWQMQIFPELLIPLLKLTRQEVYFFSLPAGSRERSPRRDGSSPAGHCPQNQVAVFPDFPPANAPSRLLASSRPPVYLRCLYLDLAGT